MSDHLFSLNKRHGHDSSQHYIIINAFEFNSYVLCDRTFTSLPQCKLQGQFCLCHFLDVLA